MISVFDVDRCKIFLIYMVADIIVDREIWLFTFGLSKLTIELLDYKTAKVHYSQDGCLHVGKTNDCLCNPDVTC